MNAIQTIHIKGKDRQACFTLLLLKHAKDNKLKIELPTVSSGKDNGVAAVAAGLALVWTALKVGHQAREEEFDVTLTDVEVWATENQERFAELMRVIAWVFTGEPTAREKEAAKSEKKTKKKCFWRRITGR